MKGSRDTDRWIEVGLIETGLRTVKHASKLSKEEELEEDEILTVRVRTQE